MGLQLNIGHVIPVRRARRARGGFGMLPCPVCNDTLLAPDSSEYVGDGGGRHLWSCDACGHEFQATVDVAAR